MLHLTCICEDLTDLQLTFVIYVKMIAMFVAVFQNILFMDNKSWINSVLDLMTKDKSNTVDCLK